jgi:hypothetical protein
MTADSKPFNLKSSKNKSQLFLVGKSEELEHQVAKAPPGCGTANPDQPSVFPLHAHFELTKDVLNPCTGL